MELDLDAINTLIAGEAMKKSEEKTLLAALLQEKPAMLSQIVQLLLQQRRDAQKELGRVEIREKKARIAAHESFDELWQEGHMKRGEAYSWLAGEMGVDQVHIGEMGVDECEQVVDLSGEKLTELEDAF